MSGISTFELLEKFDEFEKNHEELKLSHNRLAAQNFQLKKQIKSMEETIYKVENLIKHISDIKLIKDADKVNEIITSNNSNVNTLIREKDFNYNKTNEIENKINNLSIQNENCNKIIKDIEKKVSESNNNNHTAQSLVDQLNELIQKIDTCKTENDLLRQENKIITDKTDILYNQRPTPMSKLEKYNYLCVNKPILIKTPSIMGILMKNVGDGGYLDGESISYQNLPTGRWEVIIEGYIQEIGEGSILVTFGVKSSVAGIESQEIHPSSHGIMWNGKNNLVTFNKHIVFDLIIDSRVDIILHQCIKPNETRAEIHSLQVKFIPR